MARWYDRPAPAGARSHADTAARRTARRCPHTVNDCVMPIAVYLSRTAYCMAQSTSTDCLLRYSATIALTAGLSHDHWLSAICSEAPIRAQRSPVHPRCPLLAVCHDCRAVHRCPEKKIPCLGTVFFMASEPSPKRQIRPANEQPYVLLQCDFYINTSRQIQAHQRVNGFICRINNVHQTLVRTDFELVT